MGIFSKDRTAEIQAKLDEIKEYYTNLSALYSLRNDIVEATDRRHSLNIKITEFLDQHTEEYKNLFSIMQSNIETIEKNIESSNTALKNMEEAHTTIEEFYNFINEDIHGQSRKNLIEELLNDESIKELLEYSNLLHDGWKRIFQNTDTGEQVNLVEQALDASDKITTTYKDLFVSDDEKSSSKIGKINAQIKAINNAHSRIVSGYTTTNDKDEEVQVKPFLQAIIDTKEDIDDTISDLEDFHTKIFGTDEKSGLKQELEERKKNLVEIEEEAKKILNLASDAGLAGGFHERGKNASDKRRNSLIIFITILLLMGGLNYDFFKELSEIKLESLFARIALNIPFVWIAIVSNINLNKYARLEEEYAHKESLAKSYEKYKDEINKLGNGNSEQLLADLMETNIKAFDKNPALTMDSAKSDLPIENFRPKGSFTKTQTEITEPTQ